MINTSSCLMKGAIGSLVVHNNLMYKERLRSRTEVRRRSRNNLGAQIVTEPHWGPARAPPCARLENLQAQRKCKYWMPERRIQYRFAVKTRIWGARKQTSVQIRSENVSMGCQNVEFSLDSQRKRESRVPKCRNSFRLATKMRRWGAITKQSL